MANPLRSELARYLIGQGWLLTITPGGHVRGLHPDAARPLFFAATTGDTVYQPKKVRAQAARLIREGLAQREEAS